MSNLDLNLLWFGTMTSQIGSFDGMQANIKLHGADLTWKLGKYRLVMYAETHIQNFPGPGAICCDAVQQLIQMTRKKMKKERIKVLERPITEK